MRVIGGCKGRLGAVTIAAAMLSLPIALAEPMPAVEFVFIPATDAQPDGPSYDFRIGRFEITNEQFVAFLNDAMANLDNERGAFTYFDVDSGDVYVHTDEEGTTGTEGTGTLFFGVSTNPYISYNDISGAYQVSPLTFANHPVAGVTWYGALKFCNWLTLEDLGSPDERAYTEATSSNLDGWHPVTIALGNWETRDLNSAERDELQTVLGYRLPMDGGDDAGDPGSYNEWYKAAAWDQEGDVNHEYGFGRDTIEGADANFRCSGDPFEEFEECFIGGTTPVDYYDGSDHGGAYQTNPNANAYDLFDMSGNVWEWMQDRSFEHGDRRNRGGSYRSSTTALRLTLGTERAANSASDSTGFRVVQSVVEKLLVTPAIDLVNDGVWGGPYDEEDDPTAITYRVTNVTDQAVRFTASAGIDDTWITVDYDPPVDDLLPAYESLEVNVSIAPQCDGELSVGANVATVTFLNLDDGARIERNVRLAASEPLSITPTGEAEPSMVLGGETPTQIYTLTSRSDTQVSWSANWVDTTIPPTEALWLTINGDPEENAGVVEPLATSEVTVGFEVDGLPAGTYLARVTFKDECTGREFVRLVTLLIRAPFSVLPEEDVDSIGVELGPFVPPSHIFTLESLADNPVDWSVILEPVDPETTTDWLEVSPDAGTLLELGEEVEIVASFTAAAEQKETGTYSIKLRFEQPLSGIVVERTVTLEVIELVVEPQEDASFAGLLGGPFEPASFVYTLHNRGLAEMEWAAEFVETTDPPSGRTWVELSETFGVILNPDGTAAIDVTPTEEAAVLDTGRYTGTITFTNLLTGASTQREVTLLVGSEAFSITMAHIPIEHVQPDGPDYLYRIARYEVTNAEFVRFLNDSLDDLPQGSGSFIEHDAATGVVSLNGDGTVLFDPSVTGAIELQEGSYLVTDGKQDYPAAGVSWYGALKFCNWMTLKQGMNDPDQRVYHEGGLSSDWYPMGAPSELIGLRGFRLPMDDGVGEASAYNEWYKAAAWKDGSLANSSYGFGREILGNVDANFRDSGDSFEPGPSPVGFYDGSNLLYEEGPRTANTGNSYGLYDMTGNVAEWVQDIGDSAAERGIRGGNYDNPAASPLLNNDGRGSAPAVSTLASIGFRLVQAIDPVELEFTTIPMRLTGFVGGATAPDTVILRVYNPGDQTVDNMTLNLAPPWLEVVGSAPTQVGPLGTIDIVLQVSEEAIEAGISPAPPGSFALVPASDTQDGGPDYDYWIGLIEVTNTDFAGFLSDALADAQRTTPGPRSSYLYFDLDSGSVYLNDQETGEEGTAAPSASLDTLIYDASVGRIGWVDDEAVVDDGFVSHPVVGVTWYGALKYCNWLSLDEGIPASLRAYEEATSSNLSGWHPVVVDDATWLSTGMEGARRLLVEDTLGYRLPMNGGIAGGNPGRFNEWHKATSSKGLDVDGVWAFGAEYGFGRDGPLTPADANYYNSGDTEQEGTTVARFFNGSRTLYQEQTGCFDLPDPTETKDTDNGYGLYDACGNVAEWTQEFGNDPDQRSLGGGSWRDSVESELLTTAGRGSRAPELTADDVGFRLVRGTGHVVTVVVADSVSDTTYPQRFILDLREPLDIQPLTDMIHTDRYGHLVAQTLESYTVTNQSASDMEWEISVSANWLEALETVSNEASGILSSGEIMTIAIGTTDLVSDLGPGEHATSVTFRNVTSGESQERDVEFTIEQPIRVTASEDDPQEFTGLWGGPFEVPFTFRSFELASEVDFDLEYQVSVNRPLLTVAPANPVDELSGVLSAGNAISFKVTPDELADSLSVGDHESKVTFRFTDPTNGRLTGEIEQIVTVVVEEPLDIVQLFDPWEVGPGLDPDQPGALPWQEYTLTNLIPGSIPVEISVDKDWVDLDSDWVEVFHGAGQERIVTASLNANALTLFDGTYTATLSFEDTLTGITLCRTIELIVEEELSVAPFGDLVTAGVAGGLIYPNYKLFTVTNVGRDNAGPLDWEAVVQPPALGIDWVLVNNASTTGGTLADGESAQVLVAIDPTAVADLPEGEHEVTVEFRVLPDSEPVFRKILLTLIVPKFNVGESSVSAEIEQFDGPDYTYRMGIYHTTNVELVAFLNDARIHPTDERGQYMFFDTATGDVYVNSSITGQAGADPGERTIKMFSPAATGQIEYLSGSYSAVTTPIDYSTHPAAGVSWYGAVKYCNWLSIDQGMLPGERCYYEDTDSDLAGWHAMTITSDDWALGDLDDTERLSLVTGYRGYRLPMDQGFNNSQLTTDSPDTFNEWYKAAAWNSTLNRNTLFGFGRDTLTGADANFLDSGDPFEPETTPVGYFDGSSPTNPSGNQNSFGLFDMTGNVYHWMQGRFNNHPDSLTFRTVRGGSWGTSPGSSDLQNNSRTFTKPEFTSPLIGFRVIRVVPQASADFDADGDVDKSDFSLAPVCLTGPQQAIITGCDLLDLDSDADADLDDFASFMNSFTGAR